MNKYQKALSNITFNNLSISSYKTIEELVDLATPKKPVDKQNQGVNECSHCGYRVHLNFCPNCGQALDWSDEE